MAELHERMVNIIPNTKIKREIPDDSDDVVACRLCSKGFASHVALRNHVRMEHMDAFETGDSSVWTQSLMDPVKYKKLIKQEEEKQIKIKTEMMVSSMEPTSIMSLASKDVSYIIIKAEDVPGKKRKLDKKDKEKPIVMKKEKEAQPITGPFECLQSSNLVADGTCHQIFFSCCEYSIHFRDEHNKRRKGLKCQVCEKPLISNDDQQFPFFCDVCGAGFQTSKELADHTAIAHIKLKPFQCTICNKRFTQQGGLQQHTRMHTGDRPFPCIFCPKAFTQKSGLDQHLRTHTKIKPYRCVVCNKTFSQSVHLKQHMRTHTNVSPFQCGICEKRFKQSSHLNYHLKNHNPTTMTDEQKRKYAELIGLMSSEIVEVEIDQSQTDLQNQEQDVAEKSMPEGYILGNDNPWHS